MLMIRQLRSPTILSKVKMCRKGDNCNRAENCNFAHKVDDLMSNTSYFKTKVCLSSKERCNKGLYCRNFHEPQEMHFSTIYKEEFLDEGNNFIKHDNFVKFVKEKDIDYYNSFLHVNQNNTENKEIKQI